MALHFLAKCTKITVGKRAFVVMTIETLYDVKRLAKSGDFRYHRGYLA